MIKYIAFAGVILTAFALLAGIYAYSKDNGIKAGLKLVVRNKKKLIFLLYFLIGGIVFFTIYFYDHKPHQKAKNTVIKISISDTVQ
jgi:hypothetical protein